MPEAHPVEMVALTFVLELPADLGLPDDSTLAIYSDKHSFRGWNAEELIALIGAPHEVPETDAAPSISLWIRRAPVNVGMPTEATDRTFARLDLEYLSPLARWLRRARLRRLSRRGVEVFKTVVAMSCWHDPDEPLPQRGDDLQPWLSYHFHRVLPKLNDFLISLGLVTGNARLGALAITDLPSGVPVVLRNALGPDQPVSGATAWFALHEQIPDLVDHALSVEDAESAGLLWAEAHREEEPLFGFFAAFHEAQREVAAGRYAASVTGLASAIEILVRTIDRECGQVITSASGRRRPSWREVLAALPAALECESLELDSPDNALGGWYAGAYALRNNVVHEGRAPNERQAREAVEQTLTLANALGAALAARPEWQPLGRRFPLGPPPPRHESP